MATFHDKYCFLDEKVKTQQPYSLHLLRHAMLLYNRYVIFGMSMYCTDIRGSNCFGEFAQQRQLKNVKLKSLSALRIELRTSFTAVRYLSRLDNWVYLS